MSRILVIGASGTVGTELVKELKKKGQQVIRTTSKKSNLEPDQVHLDLLNHQGLDQAFVDVDRVFFLSPPGYTNQNELLVPIIEKAKQKKIKKAVMMSAMGANAYEAAPLRQAEIQLEKSGVAYNIIRPNWFMQNFNTFWIEGILKANTIFLPVGEAKTSFIDARDIAAVAAELLTTERYNNQDFDLTGSESLTHQEAATLISESTGKRIGFQDISSKEMLGLLQKAGLPTNYSEFLIMILAALKEGHAERRTDAVEKITGRKPRSFKQYTLDYKTSWIS